MYYVILLSHRLIDAQYSAIEQVFTDGNVQNIGV